MVDTATDRDDSHGYPFAVTVALAVFAIHHGVLHLALVRRAEEPSRGSWALPGGFLRLDEDLDHAAVRELLLGTGVRRGADWHLEQLGSYSAPGRDRRMVTVAYVAVCPEVPRPDREPDAPLAAFRPLHDIGPLAFDHGPILGDALERIRSKMEYTTLGVRFLRAVFTVTELREVYETIWGARLDQGNFQRGFRANTCFRRVGDARGARGRPASLWSVVGAPGGGQLRLLERPLARRNAGRA